MLIVVPVHKPAMDMSSQYNLTGTHIITSTANHMPPIVAQAGELRSRWCPHDRPAPTLYLHLVGYVAEKYDMPESDGHTTPAASQVGELRFTVVPAEAAATDASPDAAATPFVATVRRQGAAGPLPGEERILRSFRAVCRRHRTPAPAGSEGVRQMTHNLLCCVIKCCCPGVDRILPGGAQTPWSAGAGRRQRGEPLVPCPLEGSRPHGTADFVPLKTVCVPPRMPWSRTVTEM